MPSDNREAEETVARISALAPAEKQKWIVLLSELTTTIAALSRAAATVESLGAPEYARYLWLCLRGIEQVGMTLGQALMGPPQGGDDDD